MSTPNGCAGSSRPTTPGQGTLPTLDEVARAGGDVAALRELAESDSKGLSKALAALGFAKLGDRSVLRQLLRAPPGAPSSSSSAAAAQRPRTAPAQLSAGAIVAAVEEWLAPAVALKEQGNACYKAGEHEKACALYEEAARSLPAGRPDLDDSGSSHLRWRMSDACTKAKLQLISSVWSNVAAARLKLEQWEAAEAAASTVLRLDPRHAKALFRRAVARRHRGQLQPARCDLMNALHADASLRGECERELCLIDPSFKLQF
mmetsp:Transcript_58110/g.172755  ORF Transcript_58110/g.172755 Transcript_58110/m.172755 type:complete len:261 (+) Transcript_58110:1-783(+)